MTKIRINKLSIVLPAFNEEKNVEKAIDQVILFAQKRKIDYEVIIVNDGSSDKTKLIVEKAAKRNKKITLINHSKNQGYGAAVYSGLRAAKGDFVFFTDSDLQFDISELDVFLKNIKPYDAIFGYRVKRSEGFLRKINMFGWKIMIRVFLGLKIKDVDCAFKLFKRETLKNLDIKSTGATFSGELAYKIKQKKLKILELPVKHFKRQFGSPTGSRLKVIFKGFRELFELYSSEPKLVKSRSLYIYILSIIVLFLSRFLFVSRGIDFFDAHEYIARTGAGDLISAIGRGHPPFHPTYLFFSYLLYHYLSISTEAAALILTNVIFGTIAIIFAFLTVREIISSKVAWLSSIFYALIPFVYISQITILVDPSMQAFYFISLYLFALAIKSKSKLGYLLSFFAGLSISISALSHTQIAFWIFGFVAIIILCQKAWDFKSVMVSLLKTIILAVIGFSAIFVYIALLLNASPVLNLEINTAKEALKFLLFGNVGDRSSLEIVRIAKYYFLLPSSIIGLFAILFSITALKKQWKVILILLLWGVPGFILTSSYIYENLHGRAMMIGLLPICVLASMFILNFRLWKIRFGLSLIVILQLLCITVFAVISYRSLPSAFEELAKIQKESSQDGTFVSSNVSRTWHDYKGEFVNFGDVGVGAGLVQQKTEESLNKKEVAYVSSDAVHLPYRRYDGKYYDIRSTGIDGASGHTTILDNLFNQKSIFPYRVSPDYRLMVYQIADEFSYKHLDGIPDIAKNQNIVFGHIAERDKPISMLTVNAYAESLCNATNDDLFRFDFAICAWREIRNTKQTDNWSFTDQDGWFYLPTKQNKFDLVIGPVASSTRWEFLGSRFTTPGPIKVESQKSLEYHTLNDLKEAIKNEKGSFYVMAKYDGQSVVYNLNKFNFTLPTTDRLEAENLGGQGEVVTDKNASGKAYKTNNRQTGYLLSGPYLELPKGHYELTFRLRSKAYNIQNSLIEIDVTDSNSGRAYYSERFGADKFAGDEFLEQKISFRIDDEAQSVEFRIRTFDKVKLDVDFISLVEN